MPLNKQKGNMYSFVSHTFNTVKGKCPHDCSYCYMKRFKQPELHFDESELKTDLGHDNFIFVGSSCDMFADQIPLTWIRDTINHCINADHRNNKFLFQSKNPHNFSNWAFPENTTLGTTIESNWDHPEGYGGSIIAGQPAIEQRVEGIKNMREFGYPVIVTIEPLMRFNLRKLSEMISDIRPQWVNIGANTNHKIKLPEPEPNKIKELIEALSEFTEVKMKNNLKRLL